MIVCSDLDELSTENEIVFVKGVVWHSSTDLVETCPAMWVQLVPAYWQQYTYPATHDLYHCSLSGYAPSRKGQLGLRSSDIFFSSKIDNYLSMLNFDSGLDFIFLFLYFFQWNYSQINLEQPHSIANRCQHIAVRALMHSNTRYWTRF